MTTALQNIPAIPGDEVEIMVAAELTEAVDALESQFDMAPAIKTNDDCEAINSMNERAADITKDLESKRKAAKAPFLQLGKKIDAAIQPLIDRAQDVKTKTADQLREYQREMQAKAAEQERLQRQAEDERQEKERLAEIKRLKALVAGKPAPKAPPPPLPQPVVAKVEVPKINVTTVTRKVLMIGDRTKIPHYVDNAAGVRYWLLIPDEARIKDAIKAGFVVPGCSIVEEEGTRQR